MHDLDRGHLVQQFRAVAEPGARTAARLGRPAGRAAERRAAYGERRLVRKGIPFRTPTYEVDPTESAMSEKGLQTLCDTHLSRARSLLGR